MCSQSGFSLVFETRSWVGGAGRTIQIVMTARIKSFTKKHSGRTRPGPAFFRFGAETRRPDELCFFEQISLPPQCESLCELLCRQRRRLQPRVVWKLLPFSPRNPQPGNIGHAQDDRKKETQCISTHRFVHSCTVWSCCCCRQHRSRKLGCPLRLARPRCRCMSSRFVPATVISGRPATGLTTTTSAITTGCRAPG